MEVHMMSMMHGSHTSSQKTSEAPQLCCRALLVGGIALASKGAAVAKGAGGFSTVAKGAAALAAAGDDAIPWASCSF